MTDHGNGLVGLAHTGCYIASRRRDETTHRDEIGFSAVADTASTFIARTRAASIIGGLRARTTVVART